MDRKIIDTNGLRQLVEKYKKAFRIPENLDHYTDADYQIAEKKYLKHILNQGRV